MNLGLKVAAGPGEGDISPTSGAHPMEIATDGAGTVFGGQARQERLVVEIMDPGRKTIGSTSLAEMGVNEDAAIQEVWYSPCNCPCLCPGSPLLPILVRDRQLRSVVAGFGYDQ